MIKEISKTLSIIFVATLCPVMVFVVVTSRTSLVFGVRSFVVLTGSMMPKLPVGSLIFTNTSSVYQKGDIITFQRGDVSVTHRIVETKNGQFKVKGDNNKVADPQLVNKSNIIGKTSIVIPNVGLLIHFIKTPFGFLIFMGIPTFVFIGFELANIKCQMEIEIEKKLNSRINSISNYEK